MNVGFRLTGPFRVDFSSILSSRLAPGHDEAAPSCRRRAGPLHGSAGAGRDVTAAPRCRSCRSSALARALRAGSLSAAVDVYRSSGVSDKRHEGM